MPKHVTLSFVVLGCGLWALNPHDAAAKETHNTPATAVPQFSPQEAPNLSLWPVIESTGVIRLRPGGVGLGTTRAQLTPFPEIRDSTQYTTQTAPGLASGHELFMSVAAPDQRDEFAVQSPWIVSAYNAGIQSWNVRNPEAPVLASQRDGWRPPFGPGQWARFPAFGEVDTYVQDVGIVESDGTWFVGVAATLGVGFSIWLLDPQTGALTQIYQDVSASSIDVSMVRDADGAVYAFTGDRGTPGNVGIRMYDVDAALTAPVELCIDEVDGHTCGVFVGNVGDVERLDYVSALAVDERLYVAASAGNANEPITLKLWQVGDDPTLATLRYNAPGSRFHAPQLFAYGARHYLAFVDKSDGLSTPGVMRIHDVESCLDEDGCADLGPPLAEETLRYSAAGRHFLDVSFSGGVPFLHYGMQSTGLSGAGFERLWDLSELPRPYTSDTLPELTDGGGSYRDPCTSEAVDYFGDNLQGNGYGLRNFMPRHAVFSGPYLYRATTATFDVHVRTLETCGDGVVQASEACDDLANPQCVDCRWVEGSSGGVDATSDGTDDDGESASETTPSPGDGDTTDASSGVGSDGSGARSETAESDGGCACAAGSSEPSALLGFVLFALGWRRSPLRCR